MHFHVEKIHQTFLDSYFSRKTLHFKHKLRENIINMKQLTRALRAIVTLLLQMRRKKIYCIVLRRLSSIYSSFSTRTLSCQFILSLRSLHLPLSLILTAAICLHISTSLLSYIHRLRFHQLKRSLSNMRKCTFIYGTFQVIFYFQCLHK